MIIVKLILNLSSKKFEKNESTEILFCFILTLVSSLASFLFAEYFNSNVNTKFYIKSMNI